MRGSPKSRDILSQSQTLRRLRNRSIPGFFHRSFTWKLPLQKWSNTIWRTLPDFDVSSSIILSTSSSSGLVNKPSNSAVSTVYNDKLSARILVKRTSEWGSSFSMLNPWLKFPSSASVSAVWQNKQEKNSIWTSYEDSTANDVIWHEIRNKKLTPPQKKKIITNKQTNKKKQTNKETKQRLQVRHSKRQNHITGIETQLFKAVLNPTCIDSL